MSVIDDVRDRLDVVELIGQYVPLRKAGRTYKALCPFHAERTPSFVVYPDTGSWRCFGACATGGDAFDFVMRVENVDFKGSLELLARRTGVELVPPSEETQAARAERDRLRAAVAAAADFYHTLLMRSPSAEIARRYLSSRGFSSDVARSFRLGFAPDEWSVLGNHLHGLGFADRELLAAGLARPRDSGGVYDTFRGRLTIPISDSRGRAIGFGARSLDPEGVPKYLNSPQSPVFDKGRVLYGLDRAARAIRQAGEVVIVEGYTDVIRAHSAGFENVVASLGTALTAHHVASLKRYASTIVLALDADAAGQAATLRGLDVARQAAAGGVIPIPTGRGWINFEPRLEVALKVATLPTGQDPDDVIRDTPDLWPRAIENARPLMEYLFAALTDGLDLRDPDQKAEAADRLMPMIAAVADPVARSAWVGRLAELLRIDERTLSARLLRPRRDRRPDAAAAAAEPDDATAPPAADVPRDPAAWLIGALLQCPPNLVDLDDALEQCGQAALAPSDFDRAPDRQLVLAIRCASRGAPGPDVPPGQRLDSLPDDVAAYASLLRDRAGQVPCPNAAERVRGMWMAVLQLRKDQRNRALEGLHFLQAEAPPDGRAELDRQVAALTVERAALEQLLDATRHGTSTRSSSARRSAPR